MEKFTKSILCGFLCTILGTLLMGNSIYAAGPKGKDANQAAYAQLSSFTTQMPNANACTVKFEKTEALSGLTVQGNSIKVGQQGTYVIVVRGEAGTKGLAIPGYLTLWINRNGTQVPHTASVQSVYAGSIHAIMTEALIELQAGDAISVGCSSTSAYVGLIAPGVAQKQSTTLPSATLTIHQVDAKGSALNSKFRKV
jgi:hypothetical protein